MWPACLGAFRQVIYQPSCRKGDKNGFSIHIISDDRLSFLPCALIQQMAEKLVEPFFERETFTRHRLITAFDFTLGFIDMNSW